MPDDNYKPGERYEIPAAIAVPGLTIRASYSLGGDNRILQFEQTVDRDEPEAEILRRSESMTRVADQLRAKFELPGLRRQRKGLQERHDENLIRHIRSQKEIDAYKQARIDKAQQLDVEFKKVYDHAYEAHARSGRQADFQPQGSVKSKLMALQSEQEKLNAPIESHEQDALRRLAEVEEEIKQGERALAQLDELITEDERLARGEDISGV